MNNSDFKLKEYKAIYSIINSNISAKELLEGILCDYDQKTKDELIKKCMCSVASFESVMSCNIHNDILTAFYEELERADVDVSYDYMNKNTFKLKCLSTIYEYLKGNYETIPEATYRICSSRNYSILEDSIVYGKVIENETEICTILFDLLILILSIPTGIFYIPVLTFVALKYYYRNKIFETRGLIKSYREAKKALNPKDESPFDSDTDYEHEYFDPTYVNM